MDWIAGILELCGSYMIGEKEALGFIVNVVALSCWVYVSIQRKIYGLLLVAIPAIVINLMNFFKWRGE